MKGSVALRGGTYALTKRAFDTAAAGILLVALLPVLAVTALLVRLRLGRPVIFSQRRPGADGEIFTLYKFRSMTVVDQSAGLTSDLERMTPFGELLRSTSIDELPSLWNILKGEMSFVGPRPLRVAYLPRYSPEQSRRHQVRPGLTGLAQVSGRNLIDWDDRLALDVEYVERRSWKLDVAILARTVATVLRQTGISQSDEATMTEFYGPMTFPDLELVPLRESGFLESQPSELVQVYGQPDFGGGELSSDVFYQLLANRLGDPMCHDWVARDPQSSRIHAVCGLTVCGGNVAALYVAALSSIPARSEIFWFEVVSMMVSRALARGIGKIQITCNAHDRICADLLNFGFVGGGPTDLSGYRVLSFITNPGLEDD